MTDNFDVDADVYDGLDIEGITDDGLDAVATDAQEGWRDNMADAGYRNTGESIRSISIETPEQFVRLVGSDRIAVLIGEFGRPPGAGHPPPDELGDWVHEQAGLPSRGGSVEWTFDTWSAGEGTTHTVSFDQVVYIIGRAINERGLEAHHFGERAARDARDLDEELERRLQAALEEQSVE